MAGVIYNSGLNVLAYSEYPNGEVPGYVHFYNNDLTPDENTVLSDFTEPTDDPYYQVNPIQHAGGNLWSINPISLSPGDTIYGWFITDSTGTDLWFAGRFDNAPLVTGALPVLNFNLTINANVDNTTNGAFTTDGLNVFAGSFSQFPQLAFRLFTNNVNVTSSTQLSDLTECNDPAYNWTTVSINSVNLGNPAVINFSGTFMVSGAATIYGYMVTDESKQTLYWAETFSFGPVQIPSIGGEIVVSPNILMSF